ncbi:exocyst complex component 5 [Clonorchis sinensis]|uniref:Exocyst complex component 5 n=1 Tax=Clonorchis sinensis TaxID=79923 RepID=H2KNL2_CLOSI|nr:exocyst complex component 5 [Clonorchis sinensis]
MLVAFSAVCPTSPIRPQDHWMSARSQSMIDARKSIPAGDAYDGARKSLKRPIVKSLIKDRELWWKSKAGEIERAFATGNSRVLYQLIRPTGPRKATVSETISEEPPFPIPPLNGPLYDSYAVLASDSDDDDNDCIRYEYPTQLQRTSSTTLRYLGCVQLYQIIIYRDRCCALRLLRNCSKCEVNVGIVRRGTNHGVALIDRLTKSTVGMPSSETDLKPRKLIENFGIALHELLTLKAKLEDRSLQLEAKCRLDERSFRITIERLRKDLTELHDQFSKLDTQVHMVSGKLAHLGDQLERKNLPRKRIEEARDLILEFYKFLGAGGGTFANVAVNLQGDETQLLEAAKRIKNLNSLCFELPDDERFLSAKQRVTVAHQQLEATLLERFRVNCAERNTAMMKSIADALINSKGHTMCMEILIEETLKGINSRNLDFEAMTTRLVAAEQDIMEVFSRPEATLMQLINSLFTNKLKPHMDERIRSDMSSEMYLINLYTEYQNMDKLMKALCDRLTLVTDPSQLSRLFRELFANYLSQYAAREKECLTRRLKKHLDQFYEARGHQKRPLTSSGIADFKRDLRVKLHMLSDQRSMVDFEGSLLSEEVVVNIIEDVRRAAKRCLVLSQPTEFAANGMALFDILNEFLVVEHVRYGVVIALQGLQTMDARTVTPNMVFFSVVRDCTSIIQFFGKTVDESIFPLVSASPTCFQEINSKRQSIQQKLEAQLQSGLDRCLNLIISHVQHVLSTEQRKTDFRPDSAVGIPVGGPPSQACQRVVGFLAQVANEARRQLDGQNLKNFFTELGMRLNRTLVDHFYGFTFSDTGGFLAMQDVTAYRDLASQFGSPVVHGLFDVLLKLMNLMLIKPDNVQQVSQDYLQSGIPIELLQNFIQLRADYKEARMKMEIRKPSR